ncbi:MAG: tRNA lysidine(34) synthetase TilS [Gammaproteobacteria bacterium]|nr:tRNA lysidine(34) synthetase TilS [Gammaproteobacteria bacterium]
MTFTEQSLSAQLAGIPEGSRLVVAFSGGLDSSVLLWALYRLLQQSNPGAFGLAAIHVNHGLSPNAASWQQFCADTCVRLGIELSVERVHISRHAGASLENLARQQRYAAFTRCLQPGDCLVMGHHLDDQAETFLLRTLRGSGPRGLAAMPGTRTLGHGASLRPLLRPLLAVTRQALEDFARAQQLQWIEDESNDATVFDRNYCRHELLPVIARRWPAYRENWLRSAQLCAEAEELLQELAAQDYALTATEDETVIAVDALNRLSPARQRNLLRYWLQRLRVADPGWNALQQIVTELLPAAVDAQPEVSWGDRCEQGGEEGRADGSRNSEAVRRVLRRYRDRLYLLHTVPPLASQECYEWCPPAPLALPGNGGLRVSPSCGSGLRQLQQDTVLRIRYRQGGESFRLAGRRTRPLKKILQDAVVAPWLRERLPLLYAGDELVCIPGIGVCEGWQAQEGERSWEVIWTLDSGASSC